MVGCLFSLDASRYASWLPCSWKNIVEPFPIIAYLLDQRYKLRQRVIVSETVAIRAKIRQVAVIIASAF